MKDLSGVPERSFIPEFNEKGIMTDEALEGIPPKKRRRRRRRRRRKTTSEDSGDVIVTYTNEVCS